MQKKSPIILGIDPGTQILGYGLIRIDNRKPVLLEMGVLKMSSKSEGYERLQKIHARIVELIQTYRPCSFAIEAPFFGKNVQSMLKLGRAQGVAIAAAIQEGLPVFEYAPKKVKLAVTGQGNASKEQVQKMLQQLTGFKEVPGHFDATDALAVAVCHFFQEKGLPASAAKSAKGWEAFIKKNPERLVRKA